MPSLQSTVSFLLFWTTVSVPLAMLVGAMIKFGAGEKLSLSQIDRKFEALSRARLCEPAFAENRVAALDA
jgi:hypothetical protein